MTLDSLVAKRRRLKKKLKDAAPDTASEFAEVIDFYLSILTEIQNCVTNPLMKDDNVLYADTIERVKAILKAGIGLEDKAIAR